jgi:hypothetical protein
MFRRTCITRVLSALYLAHEAAGATCIRLSLRPLSSEGHEGGITRADFRRGNVIVAPVPFRNLPEFRLVTSAPKARTYVTAFNDFG